MEESKYPSPIKSDSPTIFESSINSTSSCGYLSNNNFPKFFGYSSEIWIEKCNCYFARNDVLEEDKVLLAAFNMFDKGEIWVEKYLSWKKSVEWSEFAKDVCANFMDDLKIVVAKKFSKICQIGTIESYIGEFQNLLNVMLQHDFDFPDFFLINCFVNGLEPRLGEFLRTYELTSIGEAIEYIRWKERNQSLSSTDFSRTLAEIKYEKNGDECDEVEKVDINMYGLRLNAMGPCISENGEQVYSETVIEEQCIEVDMDNGNVYTKTVRMQEGGNDTPKSVGSNCLGILKSHIVVDMTMLNEEFQLMNLIMDYRQLVLIGRIQVGFAKDVEMIKMQVKLFARIRSPPMPPPQYGFLVSTVINRLEGKSF